MSMYADEESDEGIVPMKRSNNEGVSSAETVEGRTSPKGNGGQTAAARTLRRDTASNGLIAVRRAARQSTPHTDGPPLHRFLGDVQVDLPGRGAAALSSTQLAFAMPFSYGSMFPLRSRLTMMAFSQMNVVASLRHTASTLRLSPVL